MEEKLWLILAVAAAIIFLMLLVRWLRPREQFPYEARPLLTPREEDFYQVLRSVADRFGLAILIKLRLADVVGVQKGTDHYMTYFNKIKAKHTDFVLCDPDTLEVVAGIELDDPSHTREDRVERDKFVDKVYETAGIPLLHVWMESTEEELTELFCQELCLEELPEPQDEQPSEEEKNPDSDEFPGQ